MSLYTKFLIQTYNVGIIKKPIGELLSNGVDRGDICWINHPYKDRFFADPFLFREDRENYYLLVEEYIFWEEKGKITLLTVNKETLELVQRDVIIEEPYHLSFPFCELNGDTVICESVVAEKTTQYIIDFKEKRVVSKKVILEKGLIDAVFFEDRNNQSWILASHKVKPKEDLYLYKLIGKNYILQNQGSPIMTSIEHSRGAGRFFSYKGSFYRPVQDSTGRYGRQTKIMCVEEISENGIKTNEIQTLNSLLNPPFNETMHTFNVYENVIIVDGSRDYFRFPTKFLYKKAKWLFKGRNR